MWWDKFHEWEEKGMVGDRPMRPKSPMYLPCAECGATGQVEDGKGPWHDALEALR